MSISRVWTGLAPGTPYPRPEHPVDIKVTATLEPGTTVAEVAAWCRENGLSTADVVVTGGHLTYTRTETDDEHAQRLAKAEAGAKHADEWLVKRWRERFGNVTPDEVEP